MSYKEKPIIKIYKFINNQFKLSALIDDYENCSFTDSKYEAGQFTIQINYNIPNSQIFEKGLFIQFGNDSKDFGLIKTVSDEIGPDGKGSQIRTITGYDARILFKQRIIKNLNFGDSWSYTGSGELCMRNLINSQCGNEAENKRKLPIINTIPSSGIGSDYTVSEAYSNLYDVLVTIATQTEIGWGIEFVNNQMSLYFYNGVDRHTTVKFSTDYDSLQNGSYEDGTENFSNSVYVGGKGSGENRDIYEGETGETSPSGLDRYESWDDANSLENDDEYENEAKSKLNEYSNTVSLSGNGLAKCPYEYKKEYDVGDIITVQFSGKTAIAQILSITENWAWGQYDLQFEFGKPIPSLNRQLSYLLSKIQTYQATADSVKKSNIKYYQIPQETEQPNQDVILDVIGFTGNMGEGATFKLFFDNDSKVGAKTYHLYFKTLAGTGKLTLTSGVSGATDLELGGGTYVAIVYVDEEGNIGKVTGTSNTSELVNDANFQSGQQVQNTVNSAVRSIGSGAYTTGIWNDFERVLYKNNDFNTAFSIRSDWKTVGGYSQRIIFNATSVSSTHNPVSNRRFSLDTVTMITGGGQVFIRQLANDVTFDITDNYTYTRRGQGTITDSMTDDQIINAITWSDWESVSEASKRLSPSYQSRALTTVSSQTEVYAKLLDCTWAETGIIKVIVSGNNLQDDLIIYYGGGNSTMSEASGFCSSNSVSVISVCVQRSTIWSGNYSVWLRIRKYTTATIAVAKILGGGTINTDNRWSETTSAPSNLIQFALSRGIFGNVRNANILKPMNTFENTGGTPKYYKLTGFIKAGQNGLFSLQSRAGELLIISCGHGDGSNLASPLIKRLLNVYSKISAFSYSGSNLYVAVSAYSHQCIITQIAGDLTSISVSETTQAEFNSGTTITIQ